VCKTVLNPAELPASALAATESSWCGALGPKGGVSPPSGIVSGGGWRRPRFYYVKPKAVLASAMAFLWALALCDSDEITFLAVLAFCAAIFYLLSAIVLFRVEASRPFLLPSGDSGPP